MMHSRSGLLLAVVASCLVMLVTNRQLSDTVSMPTSSGVSASRPVAYTFGYGSLLFRPSVAASHCGISGVQRSSEVDTSRCSLISEFRPVRVAHNLERGWFASSVGATAWASQVADTPSRLSEEQQLFLAPQFLGLVRTSSPDSTVNGVIFPVTAEQMALQDEREAGYQKVVIPWNSVAFLETAESERQRGLGKMDQSIPLVTYVVKEGQDTAPRRSSPIVQSYIDMFVSGALEIDDDVSFIEEDYSFTGEALETTSAWGDHWINDRIFPYRPQAYQPLAMRIDQALLQHVPLEALQAVRLPMPGHS